MSPLFYLISLTVLALTVSSQEFVPNVPEECLTTGICEDLPDYPTERVTALIEELGPALDKYEVQDLDESETLSRAGDEDQDLCESRRKIIVPRAGRDKDGQWHYVVNQRPNPVQSFVIEVCNPVDSPCADVAHFYTGYTASCKQKFIYRKSPTLDAGGAMVERKLLFPSCCSCQYRQTGE
ncbi:neurotrophin 1-like [Cydia pomonella]|uniref:neurotrophin 1-like n=1 Tax=Cydia pomonella TaxID=82600 RepID=UPI002ADD335B|nr:neurotrophin 1-like [Cydia pomonella]